MTSDHRFTSILARISGEIDKNVIIDGKKYWDIGYVDPLYPIPVKYALPSDCRFREDIYYLSLGDLLKAAKWKAQLE